MNNTKTSSFLQKTIVVWVGALFSCTLWASAFPCIKLGYAWMSIGAGDTAAQILFAGVRFTLAGIMTIAFGSLLQGRLLVPRSAATLQKASILSLFQTFLQYMFFYIGLAHASGVNASIIEGLNVFVAVLIAGVIFRLEKVTTRKMVGCLIGFGGLILVNLSGGSIGELAWNGEGFVFISTFAYAISSVLMKRYSVTENPMLLSGWQFLIGGIVMVLIGYITGGRIPLWIFSAANDAAGSGALSPANITAGSGAISSANVAPAADPRALAMLLWLAFVSAAAYSVWSILLKHNPVSKVAVFGFMNPVIGVILSAWLLQEGDKVGLSALVSLVLVCVGIYICNTLPPSGNQS